jgi:hypothetical protein
MGEVDLISDVIADKDPPNYDRLRPLHSATHTASSYIRTHALRSKDD